MWKLVGATTSINTPITLPEDFRELLVRVHTTIQNARYYKYTFHMIRADIENARHSYVQGFNNGHRNQCILDCSLSSISVTGFEFNDASSTFGELRIWYR